MKANGALQKTERLTHVLSSSSITGQTLTVNGKTQTQKKNALRKTEKLTHAKSSELFMDQPVNVSGRTPGRLRLQARQDQMASRFQVTLSKHALPNLLDACVYHTG